jgi:hypothetical protein
MRVSFRRIVVILPVATLLGTGLGFAAPSSNSVRSNEYLSGRVLILLAEIKKEMA